MRALIGVGMLWLGLAVVGPSIGRAQHKSVQRPDDEGGDDRVGGGVVGGIVGAAVGIGFVSLLYVAMEPDGPSETSVELHGPGGEGGYEKLGQVMMTVFIGAPLLTASTALGIYVGVSAADKGAKRERKPPHPADRALRVTPLAAISPDGGYLGARLQF